MSIFMSKIPTNPTNTPDNPLSVDDVLNLLNKMINPNSPAETKTEEAEIIELTDLIEDDGTIVSISKFLPEVPNDNNQASGSVGSVAVTENSKETDSNKQAVENVLTLQDSGALPPPASSVAQNTQNEAVVTNSLPEDDSLSTLENILLESGKNPDFLSSLSPPAIIQEINQIIKDNTIDSTKATAGNENQQKQESLSTANTPMTEENKNIDLSLIEDVSSVEVVKNEPEPIKQKAAPEPAPVLNQREKEAPKEDFKNSEIKAEENNTAPEKLEESKENQILPDNESLISPSTESATLSVLSTLQEAQNLSNIKALQHEAKNPVVSTKSLDEIIQEMIRPMIKEMLKEWLDLNLPDMVEQIVQQEIRRIIHKINKQ